MIRRALLLVVALLVLVIGGGRLLADHTSALTGPAVVGTVVDHRGIGRKRFVTIRERNGDEHTARVRVWIQRACPVGATWPACREQAG